jgi:hypothetical protein
MKNQVELAEQVAPLGKQPLFHHILERGSCSSPGSSSPSHAIAR